MIHWHHLPFLTHIAILTVRHSCWGQKVGHAKKYLIPKHNIIVLDSYFKLTNKSYLIHRFWYDLIRFFDHSVVAYFFGPPCILCRVGHLTLLTHSLPAQTGWVTERVLTSHPTRYILVVTRTTLYCECSYWIDKLLVLVTSGGYTLRTTVYTIMSSTLVTYHQIHVGGAFAKSQLVVTMHNLYFLPVRQGRHLHRHERR